MKNVSLAAESSAPLTPLTLFPLKRLLSYCNNGGPYPSEYEDLTCLWPQLKDFQQEFPESKRSALIQEIFGNDCLNATCQGFAYRKPHGYAGDFEMIDHIYQSTISSNPLYRKWDLYFHAQKAPIAVRNRKNYFIRLIHEKLANTTGNIRVLNLASGPCRDILDLYQTVSNERVTIDCVEMDPKAIDYATKLLGSHMKSVRIFENNIFKFDTQEKYQFIWSAGLFDYLDDKSFKYIIRKIKSWCCPTAEIVIGNFSTDNPSRSYMEVMGEWFLHHRTANELLTLAIEAGFEKDRIQVKSEELGVNLFLHLVIGE